MGSYRPALRGVILVGLALLLLPTEAATEDPDALIQRFTEMEECYLIKGGLRQLGYLGVKVEKVKTNTGEFFKVEFGPLYRLGAISVTGIESLPLDDLLKEAPKAGDVYSPVLMRSWIAFVEKRYAEEGLPIKLVRQSGNLDHAKHVVNLTYEFREES